MCSLNEEQFMNGSSDEDGGGWDDNTSDTSSEYMMEDQAPPKKVSSDRWMSPHLASVRMIETFSDVDHKANMSSSYNAQRDQKKGM